MSFISVIQIYSAHPLYQSYCSFMCRPIQLSKIVPFYSEESKSICFQYPLTTKWDEPPDETAKTEAMCYSTPGTIKIPPCSMTVRAESMILQSFADYGDVSV